MTAGAWVSLAGSLLALFTAIGISIWSSRRLDARNADTAARTARAVTRLERLERSERERAALAEEAREDVRRRLNGALGLPHEEFTSIPLERLASAAEELKARADAQPGPVPDSAPPPKTLSQSPNSRQIGEAL